jgi:hypothetical protein
MLIFYFSEHKVIRTQLVNPFTIALRNILLISKGSTPKPVFGEGNQSFQPGKMNYLFPALKGQINPANGTLICVLRKAKINALKGQLNSNVTVIIKIIRPYSFPYQV